ncbi:mediator of RNA polymerase II transcription subunit 1-domain-containing protein [Kalaharituber pfeilii]|nr:mediator of RNA polymerase II transcription subunit 1-domain-containing protein [Kalaharituber pfeilii]
MTTPKIAGMTPGAMANLTFSPAVNSPATLAAQLRHRGSPANYQLTFTPNTAAAAEAVASLGLGSGLGRTPVYLANQIALTVPSDENKKRELEEILRTLALKPGRISVEGIERLAKRLRMECWKETIGNVQTISLGGAIIVVDIDFVGNHITQVALSYANTLGASNDLAPLAAAILKKNLQPDKPLMISDLTDFANNLERLSKLDKLSNAHSMNCFTAITGLYKSLSMIFDYEKSVMENGTIDAMCKGNGRPRMHVNGKVGLSIEYWMERRKLPSSKVNERDPAARVHDVTMGEADAGQGSQNDEELGGRTWRVIIEIDELGPECTSLDTIRTSENWVNKNIIKPSEDSMFGDDEFVIDWLDPEPSVETLMEVDSQRGNARFIARLDPPIVVPLLDEVTIFTSLGLFQPPGQIGATTLDGLLFPRRLLQDLPLLSAERKVHLPPQMVPEGADEDATAVFHKYTLHTLKAVYAREVWEIPFGHPRQLGPIFQIFRQYVLLATLLCSCFSSLPVPTDSTSTLDASANILSAGTASPPSATTTTSAQFTADDLDSFLSSPSTTPATSTPSTSPIPIDISLTSDPLSSDVSCPILSLIFPSHVVPQRLISLKVEVSRNGGLTARYSVVDTPEHVMRQAGVVGGSVVKGGVEVPEEAVTRAIELTEDLGIVVEWLRRRV